MIAAESAMTTPSNCVKSLTWIKSLPSHAP